MQDAAAKPKAVLAWSSGKDSAYALHIARQAAELDIVGLLTTVTDAYGRVSMHGVREDILEAQARAAGLPVIRVPIPSPCPNDIYEAAMTRALAPLIEDGVSHVVFGDLFLADLRAWREQRLRELGLAGVFPLWRRDTDALAREMIDSGIEARIVCLDPKKLDAGFAGRMFDTHFLEDLPDGIDPCGENGEFHTLATAGPMFDAAVATKPGEVVERDGFIFADVMLA